MLCAEAVVALPCVSVPGWMDGWIVGMPWQRRRDKDKNVDGKEMDRISSRICEFGDSGVTVCNTGPVSFGDASEEQLETARERRPLRRGSVPTPGG